MLRSEHGPAVATPHGTYALRFAGMGELRHLEQFYRMNRAQSFDAWRAAMRMNAIPSLNYVYADREGRIAYFYNARFPRRVPGWDWRSYLPGDRPELVWRETKGFDEVPAVIDPPSGFVVSANHTPFAVTAEGQGPDEAKIAAALPRAQTCLNALAHLKGEGPWLAGETISLADLHAAPILAYFTTTPEGQALMAGTPSLGSWWNALKSRESLRGLIFAG